MTLTTFSIKEFFQVFKFSSKSQLSATIVHTITLFFALPFVLIFAYSESESTYNLLSSYFKGVFPIFITPIMIIFTLISSATLFRYMHQKRSVDLYHAFPLKRAPLLLGRFSVSIVSLYIPITVNLIITYIVAICFGADVSDTLSAVFSFGLQYLLFSAAVLSFAMLLAVCSGTTMEMFVSGVLICAAWPLLVLFVHSSVNGFLPGFFSELSPLVVFAFSPVLAPFWALGHKMTSNEYAPASFIIWWVFLTVAMVITSVIVYKKRKSESAENANTFAPVKIVIRILSTLCAGLCFGLLFSEMFDKLISFWLGVVFGSAVIFIIIEALYMHTLKNILKSAKWFIVCIVLIAVFINIFSFGFFGYDIKTPELDDIKSAKISLPSGLISELESENQYYMYQNGNIVKKDSRKEKIITISPHFTTDQQIANVLSLHFEMNKLNRKTIYPYHPASSFNYSNTIQFEYELKDGSVFERKVVYADRKKYVNSHQYETVKNYATNIIGTEEYFKGYNLASYLEPSYFYEFDLSGKWSSQTIILSDLQKQELLDALTADTQALMADRDFSESVFSITLNLSKPFTISQGDKINILTGFTGAAEYDQHYSSFIITSECKNTIALAQRLGWNIDSLNSEWKE